jgi:hypothetical protein
LFGIEGENEYLYTMNSSRALVKIVLVSCFLVLVFLTGCVIPPASAPIPNLSFGEQQSAEELWIMLPGRGDEMSKFVTEGWVEDLLAWRRGAEVVIVDAHIGYYFSETLVDRLVSDVIDPARARGIKRFYLVGISLGGMGGILIESDLPGTLEGIVLIAPFLGDGKGPLEEIKLAGGLQNWDATGSSAVSFQVEVWSWIKNREKKNKHPWLVLGFGEKDRFNSYHKLLEEELPKQAVFKREGGHTWTVWNELLPAIFESEFINEKLSAETHPLN